MKENKKIGWERGTPHEILGIGTLQKIKEWMKRLGDEAGANWEDLEDKEIFVMCARYQKKEWMAYLLARGVDPNVRQGLALTWTAMKGNIEIAKMLLDAGADPTIGRNEALRWAKFHKNSQMEKFLRGEMEKRGVKESWERKDPYGMLGIGTRQKISEWMKKLGEEEYDENILTQIIMYSKKEWFKYFIRSGIDVRIGDDRALRYASSQGWLEDVKFLVQNGSSVHVWSNAPLRLAAEFGLVEIAKFLIKNGADIHAMKDFSLRRAAENGHVQIVKILLDAGANIHAEENVALRRSAENGHIDVVRLLLERGANPFIKDYRMDDFLNWIERIKEKGYTEIFNLLKEKIDEKNLKGKKD